MAVLRSLLVVAVVWALALGIGWGLGGLGLVAAGLALGLNTLAFVPAAVQRTERFYDLVGALTFAALVGLVLLWGAPGPRGLAVGLAIAIWSARLGSFLVRRVARQGGDGRFDEMKQRPARFLVAWTLQGLWALVCCLPLLALDAAGGGGGLGLFDLIGGGLWVLGLGTEVVADRQKEAFAREPANRGRFIATGLWARCQHPNYLGEITLWAGLFIVAAPHIVGAGWLAVLSPLFVTLLLTRVSGIPLLQARAKARWGAEPDFVRYQAQTPLLWPFGGRGA